MKELSIYTDHNHRIHLVEHEGMRYLPIKPLCELMGIDYKKQVAKLKKHYLTSGQLGTLRVPNSKDGKTYEMTCLPFIFAAGWIYAIDAKATNNPDKVAQTQALVIMAMYRDMEVPRIVQQQKIAEYERIDTLIKEQRLNFRNAKATIQDLERAKDNIKTMSNEEWIEQSQQLALDL